MSKHCPHCQGDTFKAVIKRPGAIKLTSEGAIIIKEVTDKFNFEVVECMKCHAKVSNSDLTDDVACSQCNTPTPVDDLVDGLCPVCVAMKERPELVTCTHEQLIQRLLDVEKLLNSKGASKVEQKVAEANKPAEVKVTITGEASAELSPQQKAAHTRKVNAEAKAKADAEAKANPPVTKVQEVAKEPEVKLAPAPAPNPMENMENLAAPSMPLDDPF